ncbi:HAMP domain-containing sensor histidine kinase [Chryseobacterium sp. ISL-6]|uniref:sensor histidine kinase n=1 Tax=Chryseobacterium sp. ISL-6 TaxID=2819143 RepID=UPI001BE8A986|nr:HAMP domain-containing sensor histidine kinase [Chryseobacterium sp. ISL-6]MBT2622650.1 HAMP domain-containing histidine kinase [Chryseobacterium sp. ISL-6]
MKWFTNKYAYLLAILAMLFCITLQIVWLIQLFGAQQVQVKRDLDQAVSNAACVSDYMSVAQGHEKSENFRNFFLSPEWLQIKQSFTRLRERHVGGSFSSQITPDSTFLSIGFNIANNKAGHKNRRIKHIYDQGETLESIMTADKRDLKRMDSLVKTECLKAQLNMETYHILYNYDSGKPESKADWEKTKKADYQNQLYGYNLNFFLHTYQLVVPSIKSVVYYRMRYYLLSSFSMLILTGLAFIFLFRMIHTQRMYTQARIAFTGNMTHELKTPVSVIEAALDAVSRYQLYREPEKLENYLAISKSELHRLTLMIDKVLQLDQLDHGEIKLRKELYDVQQGLEGVVSSMRFRNEQGAKIVYIPVDEPCFVDGDPIHLINVFYNLTDNALKYSGAEATIKITLKNTGDKVIISFNDNGPGINNIYQKRIFERYFRISDNPNIHNVKGSGLGLDYVKRIIEQHGGRIYLLSEPGKGSNFVIELPAYHEL